MYREREEDLSILKFVKETFSDIPFVNVVDEFPNKPLTAPTISVTNDNITYSSIEIGSKAMKSRRIYILDVFVKDRSQRDEFCYRLSDVFRNKPVQVYNFSDDINNPSPRDYCLQADSVSIDFVPTTLGEENLITHRAFVVVVLSPNKL